MCLRAYLKELSIGTAPGRCHGPGQLWIACMCHVLKDEIVSGGAYGPGQRPVPASSQSEYTRGCTYGCVQAYQLSIRHHAGRQAVHPGDKIGMLSLPLSMLVSSSTIISQW